MSHLPSTAECNEVMEASQVFVPPNWLIILQLGYLRM